MPEIDRRAARLWRHKRVRKRLVGTPERPRVNVFRSLSHIYAQVIDDAKGHTLISASTLDSEFENSLDGKAKTIQAELMGSLVARRARGIGIEQVVFDRGGYKYHGRVKAVAEAARKEGLKF